VDEFQPPLIFLFSISLISTSSGARRYRAAISGSPLLELTNMSSGTFVSINHGVGLNQHHLEWCPKYRFKSLRKKDIAIQMEMILKNIAQEKGIIIHNMVVDTDHIHLLVSIPFSMSVSKALQLLKGSSSYQIFRLHPNFRKRYKSGHFWSPGHFSRSLSNVSLNTVNHYIQSHECAKLSQIINEAKAESKQLSLTCFQ